jgi:hypothetical protein
MTLLLGQRGDPPAAVPVAPATGVSGGDRPLHQRMEELQDADVARGKARTRLTVS